MNGRHLQRLAVRQRGKQARKPLGQHRFAHSGRAGRHQVVGAGGGDLDREAGMRLADHIGEVDRRLQRRRWGVDPAVQLCLSGEPGLQLAQRPRTPHLDTVDEAGLGVVVDRDHDSGPSLAFGGQHGRQHTFGRSHPPVERQFTEQHGLFQPLPRRLAVRQSAAAASAMSKVTLVPFYAHPIRSHRNLDMPIS